MGKISGDLVYECVRFFKGQVYEWGRFRNIGSHTRTKIIPVTTPRPPTPPLAPPPHHPHTHTHTLPPIPEVAMAYWPTVF